VDIYILNIADDFIVTTGRRSRFMRFDQVAVWNRARSLLVLAGEFMNNPG